MKSQNGYERPNTLIDTIEMGGMSGKGHKLTPAQCYAIWCWIEDIEDELVDRRGWKNMHDEPEVHQDDEGYWLPGDKNDAP